MSNETNENSILLPCLYCQEPLEFDADSAEAQGIFNAFCPTGECEDRYSATL